MTIIYKVEQKHTFGRKVLFLNKTLYFIRALDVSLNTQSKMYKHIFPIKKYKTFF